MNLTRQSFDINSGNIFITSTSSSSSIAGFLFPFLALANLLIMVDINHEVCMSECTCMHILFLNCTTFYVDVFIACHSLL